MSTHIERKIGALFIKRCKFCWTRAYHRYEVGGAHRCLRCNRINVKGGAQ
jgi:hypothetical protein